MLSPCLSEDNTETMTIGAQSLDYGLLFRKNSPRTLHAFADADWAGDPNDRTSTSAYVVFLGANPEF